MEHGHKAMGGMLRKRQARVLKTPGQSVLLKRQAARLGLKRRPR